MKKKEVLHNRLLHVSVILLIGFIAYSNTFRSPFQWDEADFIVNNPFIKDLGYFAQPSRAEDLLDDALISRYIGYFTFALNYRVHGFRVFGYHLVNFAIHIINAILVYFLVLMTLRTPYFGIEHSAKSIKQNETSLSLPQPEHAGHPTGKKDSGQAGMTELQLPYVPCHMRYAHFIAFAVSLLFAVHPVQTEAVTYIFQRFASLVSMFCLLSLVFYIKGRLSAISTKHSEEESRLTVRDSRFTIIWYLLSLISAVLAMKTKENAFTLPVVIALYEFLFFSGPLKSRLLRLLPFFLTMLIVPMTIWIMESGDTAGEIIGQMKDPASLGYRKLSRAEYLFTQFRVIITYIRLLFLPVNQNINYDYPVYGSFFDLPVLVSFLFLVAVFGAAIYLVYKTHGAKSIGQSAKTDTAVALCAVRHAEYRLIAFGVLWFFLTLSVESSLVPIPILIAEYRIYLPSFGFFLAVISGLLLLFNTAHRAHKLNVVLYALCAILILMLSSATYSRNSLWKEKITLWEDTVRKSPKLPRGYNNLGIAYSEKGLYENAIAAYQYCISLYPSYRTAYANLGVALAVTGRINAAILNFRRAIAMDPKNSILHSNLARAYWDAGLYGEALANYTKAIDLDPNNSGAYQGLGTVFIKLGRPDDALSAYSHLVKLSPNDPEGYKNRGIVYANMGELANAAEDFRRACSLGSTESCEFERKARLK